MDTNYKGVRCLHTIKAFDEYGFPYWLDVRHARSDTAEGAEEIIHSVFAKMPTNANHQGVKRYVRADSGYCQLSFFNACAAASAKFVVTLTQTIFPSIEHQIQSWRSTNLSDKDRLKFYDGRECEWGETIYMPEGASAVFRVVAIRAEKDNAGGLFKDHKEYDYYSWITTIGAEEMSVEEVIKFYRGRGNGENYIRELKYGFDLKHYPCLMLSANKAFGLIGAFAHALMRFMALLHNKKRPHFAKLTRLRLVHLPVQVIRHAREVIFRFNTKHFKEVKQALEKIHHSILVFANFSPQTAVTG